MTSHNTPNYLGLLTKSLLSQQGISPLLECDDSLPASRYDLLSGEDQKVENRIIRRVHRLRVRPAENLEGGTALMVALVNMIVSAGVENP